MRIPARKPIVLGYQTTDCSPYFGGDIPPVFSAPNLIQYA
tara:strand:+ start:2341 stop:2460 length:120 start_codon:yes stop_codon:yes gene_type:complete